MSDDDSVDENVVKIYSFDGQTVFLDRNTVLYEVGNFLGGGAAGTVYECENAKTHDHHALKILNPLGNEPYSLSITGTHSIHFSSLGYKLMNPSLLKRCNIVIKGKSVSDDQEKMNNLTNENIWWVLNTSAKQFLSAYFSERYNSLKELSLTQCIKVWGYNPSGTV